MSQSREIKKTVPEELWVVEIDGQAYRIYWSLKHATNHFDKLCKQNISSRIISYSMQGDIAAFSAAKENHDN